jgi:hypothetical protein
MKSQQKDWNRSKYRNNRHITCIYNLSQGLMIEVIHTISLISVSQKLMQYKRDISIMTEINRNQRLTEIINITISTFLNLWSLFPRNIDDILRDVFMISDMFYTSVSRLRRESPFINILSYLSLLISIMLIMWIIRLHSFILALGSRCMKVEVIIMMIFLMIFMLLFMFFCCYSCFSLH